MVKRNIVSMLGQYRSELYRKFVQGITGFGIRHVEENGAYPVEYGRTVVQSNDYIFKVRYFGIVDNSLDIGILFFYSFKECRLVVLQFDFIKGWNTVRGLKLGEERITFRLGSTGVHHTTCS